MHFILAASAKNTVRSAATAVVAIIVAVAAISCVLLSLSLPPSIHSVQCRLVALPINFNKDRNRESV